MRVPDDGALPHPVPTSLEPAVPTYEYACRDCGRHTDVVQSFTDDPLTVCPSCGGRLRKVFGAIGIAFKGSGFYKNDSRAGAASAAGGGSTAGDGGSSASGESAGAAKSSPGDKTGTGKSDTGKSDTGKPDSGKAADTPKRDSSKPAAGAGSTKPAAAAS